METRWRPVANRPANAVDLSACRGRYRSPETSAVHEIAVRDGRLLIQMATGPRPLHWLPADPIAPDTFRFRVAHAEYTKPIALRFRRAGGGAIVGLALALNRSRWLEFVRDG